MGAIPVAMVVAVAVWLFGGPAWAAIGFGVVAGLGSLTYLAARGYWE